jgi:hypothetical protein
MSASIKDAIEKFIKSATIKVGKESRSGTALYLKSIKDRAKSIEKSNPIKTPLTPRYSNPKYKNNNPLKSSIRGY